jgi:cell wall-associated NlpC family hydrolase
MIRSVKIIILSGILILAGFMFCFVSYADVNKTGTVNSFNLHLRESPDSSSKILKNLSEGSSVNITEISDGWYKVDYNGIIGWVASEYISIANTSSSNANTSSGNANVNGSSANTNSGNIDTGSTGENSNASKQTPDNAQMKDVTVGKGVITGDDVRIRNGAGTSYKILDVLYDGDELGLIARSGEWFRVKISDGTIGWVYKDYIKIDKEIIARGIKDVLPEVAGQANDSGNDTSIRTRIVEYAKKFLGVRYVYGGTTPKGFDCSGFVGYVFKKFGIDLERVASDQARQGKSVKRAELKPGDLLFFDTDGGHSNVSHVGIYIGGGKFIHASSNSSRHKVTITALDSTYSRLFLKARNILD